MVEKFGLEIFDGLLFFGKMDDIFFVQIDVLDLVRERLYGGKGLFFYVGFFFVGKFVVYKRKFSLSIFGFIQVRIIFNLDVVFFYIQVIF